LPERPNCCFQQPLNHFADQQEYDQPDREEDKKQNLRDSHRCARDSGEPKQARDQCDNEKNK
jgi:hypothetical protein